MTSTTLAQALSASSQSITLTDAGDLVKGDLLALEGEYSRILTVLSPTQALLQRGVNGTPATAHAAGVTVSISVPEDFLTGPQQLPAFGIDTNVLTGQGPSAAAKFDPGGGGGSGTVTSVALTMPDLFTVTGTPITTSGTFGVTLTGILAGVNGGTGVANTGKTITLSGNLVTTGAFNPTFAIPSSSTWTFPSGGGTLVVSSGAVTSIAGTANQITASAATGAVTLSIPTNPVFSGTALTFPGLLSIASGKTLTASNTLTFTGTDSSSVAFGAGGTVLYTGGSGAALTFPGTLVIASGKTATINNTITLAGTDSTTMTFPTTSATVARTDAGQTFTGAQIITEPVGSSGLTITGATQTSSFPALNITQTWNNSGTAFTAIKANITNTASLVASLLIDLQVGGSDLFTVNRAGTTWMGGNLRVARAGSLTNLEALLNDSGIQFDGSAFIGWSGSGSFTGGSPDLTVFRDAANTFALRNSTSAQIANFYNTFTTVATAGEWFTIDWATTANVVNLQAVKGSSSGTARVMTLSYGGLKASPSAAITIPITSGNIVFGGGITTPGGATFHTTNTALTDGAGASTGTLTNAPAATNPTKWIGINDNGTTRYIPAW